MKRWPAFFFCIFIFSVIADGRAQESVPVRALWVVRDAMKTKESIDKMTATLVSAGITDVFLQVRGRGDAYYKSRIVPMAAGIDTSFDPLGYAIRKIRPHSVRIHLWLNVFLIWSADERPYSGRHVYNVFPEWSAVSGANVPMAELGTKKVRSMNHEGVFFSPSVEEYSDHFQGIVTELMRQYEFDGIHLDYIRYPGDDYDYSAAARSRFIMNYHIDPLTMKPLPSGSLSGDQKSWARTAWDQFRRDVITDFVRTLRDSMRVLNPDVRLTAAVFADLNVAKNKIFQDWPDWISRGIIDYAVVMNYATDDKMFRSRLHTMQAALGKSDFKEKVIQGIAIYNQPEKSVKSKLKICDEFQLKKWSFFSYEIVRQRPAYVDLIRSLK